MKKAIILTVFVLIIVVGVLGGIKGLQIQQMIARGKQYVPPPETVTTVVVTATTWSSVLTAVGSLEAVQGVTVTAELSGKVVQIAFAPAGAPMGLRLVSASRDGSRIRMHPVHWPG